tara:strand:- start:1432 stop:1740 length:309 start_codon:yes stop_codon:yes gene_type:complete
MSQANESSFNVNKKALAKYLIVDKGVRLTKTKSGKGFMIYNPAQITDMAMVERLAIACDFSVINSPDKFNVKTGEKQPARTYIGPVENKLDIVDVDDFMNSI